MPSKSISIIYLLLSVLIAFVLSSGVARVKASFPSTSYHITYNEFELDTKKANTSSYCEPGESCICCFHPGQPLGAETLGTQQPYYEAPFCYALSAFLILSYTNAVIPSLYRPPIS